MAEHGGKLSPATLATNKGHQEGAKQQPTELVPSEVGSVSPAPPPTARTPVASRRPSAMSRRGSEAGGDVALASIAEKDFGGKRTEREVEFAEMETRIRKFNIELLTPTIRKISTTEKVLDDLWEQVRRTQSMLGELTHTSMKVEQQVAVVDSFREEMSKWDAERVRMQLHITETISLMKQEMDQFRYTLEREDSSIHSLQRTMDRTVGELTKVQASSDLMRNHVNHSIAQNTKLLNATKTDLEVKLITAETKLNRLSDELWGEATGLNKVTRHLAATDETVAFLSRELVRMEKEKANVSQLESVQEEVNSLIRETTSNVSILKKTLDTMIGDVKDHFRTATNTVAAHSAAMLSEVRASYQEELERSTQVRTDCVRFMKEAKSHIASLEAGIGRATNQTEEMMSKVATDVDEVSKLRRRDRSNVELEYKTIREQVAIARSSSDAVAKCLKHLREVMVMLLQSEQAASALSVQDDSDRAKVALVGYRDKNATTGASGSCSPAWPSSCTGGTKTPLPPVPKVARGKSPSGKSSRVQSPVGDDGSGPVITVDQRCLSCSGHGKQVLAGFKIACLQYAPGPVTFAKRTYTRPELLEIRDRFLTQAAESLENGPVDIAKRGNLDMIVRIADETSRPPPMKDLEPVDDEISAVVDGATGDFRSDRRGSMVSDISSSLSHHPPRGRGGEGTPERLMHR
eukprot:TRINITY_DN74646_c0_g1_i1.p1 TRINITY_DN74646_c0_g1~~TRINITY_DN74646_c0_g1_i1.p1  ORF type:complete len:691 (-),score=166.17 TRINITY_DN74646_c0_g1_i1:57-2129(-)